MNQNFFSKNNRIITISCVGLFLFSIVLYIYFLSLSVTHVVFRQESVQKLNALRSEIAELDTKYIEAKHEINLELVNLNHLSKKDDKIFISHSHKNLALIDVNN